MIALALVILLALTATGWLLARRDSDATRRLAREQRTADALRIARDALIGFAATYRNALHPDADFGYLPCPDLDGDGSSETCGAKGQTSIGRLPYLTLNLPDLRDGAGECLWYAVSGSFKNNPKADTLNWDSTGKLRLLDANGLPLMLPGDEAGLAAAIVIAARAALDVLARTPDVTLVLVDWNMPEMNGLELVTEIRLDDTLRSVRLMMAAPGSREYSC